MDTKPKVITAAEWAEICTVPEVREGWGLDGFDPPLTPEDFSHSVYGVKFDFVSGGPGYIGDMFLLMGDGFSACPMVLTRSIQNGKLHPNDWLHDQ